MNDDRRQAAYRFRVEAAETARQRAHPVHRANGDEEKYASEHYAMSFTKGLQHNGTTGLVADATHFEAFRKAIDDGFIDPFTANVPVSDEFERKWEAPTAGVVSDLEGPDAQAVTMAPAPALGSDELTYEMAEVYELAIVRDVSFSEFRYGAANALLDTAITELNNLPYKPTGATGRPRTLNDGGEVDRQTVFRGSSPGVAVGPYLSQFMLIGTPDQTGTATVASGRITYGALQIDQRVPVAKEQDYMVDLPSWLEVQNGKETRNNADLFVAPAERRFISTPRDLATYVHDDALYQAYLNACLILLGMGTPFDPSFAALSGQNPLLQALPNGGATPIARHAGGFALYGGPHILTLVTEVATRALKAVRFQKFNNHIRLRPEALAQRVAMATEIKNEGNPRSGALFEQMKEDLQPVLASLSASTSSSTGFLPMAFQEGSPMHPAYGAGHATVAGACVTILKAYFDTDAVFVRRQAGGEQRELFARMNQKVDENGQPITYQSLAYFSEKGQADLQEITDGPFLTLEGELNKLAANISIGRNMAGVHYYTDYYDSLRMGEEIAIGILEEQALGYPTDRFVLSIPTFDGPVRRIGRA